MKYACTFALLSFSLGGCFVRTQPRRTVVEERRSCPPAHHWEGGNCVHNGHGHDHDDDDDHGHGHGHGHD